MLIDVDNASPCKIKVVLTEAAKYGISEKKVSPYNFATPIHKSVRV